jgi:hypothetical protein
VRTRASRRGRRASSRRALRRLSALPLPVCTLLRVRRGALSLADARSCVAGLQDLLPGILSQLGPENLANLKKGGAGGGGGAGGDDDVPEVDTFDA